MPSLLNFAFFRLSSAENAAAIGSLGGSYTIILLLGVFNIAIGCLASALTKNQLVAAMACFTFCLLHFLIGYVMDSMQVPDAFRNFVNHFSTLHHVRTFIDGLIDTRQFVYYISGAFLLLCITFHILEFRKWKV